MVVLAFAQGVDDLDEDILEKVISQLAIFSEHIDRRVDLSLVSVKKDGKCGLVSGQVSVN
jgi:hypothetical protein